MRSNLTASGPRSTSPLERTDVTEADLRLLYRHIQLGVLPSVDVLGPIFVVHLDRPTHALRSARVELLRFSILPSRCQHCRDLLDGGVAIVFSSADCAERYVPLPAGPARKEYYHAA